MEFAGKVVLITGASSGVGFALAMECVRRRMRVAATARTTERLADLVSAVAALPGPKGELLALMADVCQADEVEHAFDEAARQFGRIDIVIANAGVGQRGALADSPIEHLEAVIDTNIRGVIYTVRAAVPHLRKAGGGHIAIISSVVAPMITPYTATYSASKAAASSLARALRYELMPDRIGVSDILLGRTSTQFNAKRLGAAGYADRAPRIPMMTPDRAAAGILQAIERDRGSVTLRPFDWLIVLINRFLPQMVARRALRQYKPSLKS